MDPKGDIKRQGLGVEESVQAMKDGSIDAFFWSGGLPTGAITDLVTSDKITLLDTTVYTDKLTQKYGDVYRDDTIPKGTYKGVDKDVPTIAVPNYLVVSEKMDEKLAHDLTKLLFDQKQDLVAVHPGGQEPRPEEGAEVIAPIELHPGAKNTSTSKVRRPLLVAALAGALLAAGLRRARRRRPRRRRPRAREGGAAAVGALRARVPPLLLPRRRRASSSRRRLRLPHGRGRVAERGGARLLRDRGRQAAGRWIALAPARPQPLRPPAADRHRDRAAARSRSAAGATRSTAPRRAT